MSPVFLPPSVLGIVGGGQLGMMTVREAQRMGYRSVVWDPDPECPAARLADRVIVSPFNDRSAAKEFLHAADFITYEFEHIDAAIVHSFENQKQVRPGSEILQISQSRKREKEELRRRSFPIANFEVIRNPEELLKAIERLAFPVVLKTSEAGYDGKGQTILSSPHEVRTFEFPFSGGELIVETYLDLECEVSVIAVRDSEGEIFCFPVSQNGHRENILHTSLVPPLVSDRIQSQARDLACSVIEGFGVVGILCIEMFVTREGAVLVNELAPRPHNSGHYSLDGCDLSQFEAHVRVASGLPMRTPHLLSPCGIVNLLGKHLALLDVKALHKIPGTKLHLYGKTRVEPKRKMGHIAIVRATQADVLEGITEVEKLIGEFHPADAEVMVRAR